MKPNRTKKYKPKPVLLDTMSYAKTGMLSLKPNLISSLRIRNNASFQRLSTSNGDIEDWKQLLGASSMALKLAVDGIGEQYIDEISDARAYLAQVMDRFIKWQKWEFCSAEISSVSTMLDIHCAQLDVALVIDIERAAKSALNNFRNRK